MTRWSHALRGRLWKSSSSWRSGVHQTRRHRQISCGIARWGTVVAVFQSRFVLVARSQWRSIIHPRLTQNRTRVKFSGQYISFVDWRFVHRARLDVFPLNEAPLKQFSLIGRRRLEMPAMQLTHSETLPHVVTRQLRHNAIVERHAAASRLLGETRGKQYVPGVGEGLAAVRSGIVMTYETGVIVDVNVPLENDFEAPKNARLGKIAKCQPLADDAWVWLNCACRRLRRGHHGCLVLS
ncbi:unnamed protein product [Heterotrigona itama]|uniref:Uncharacterized protein n=1 Tax=Heterotrigona itama TaxID=395501 RepID=A0A6V7HJ77_9HYME|nr:unnamed protein product [Heterotrigona itama]